MIVYFNLISVTSGENIIKRNSSDSSVTTPLKRLFMTKEESENSEENLSRVKESLAWSGCGWPDYLLIGKGNTDGFPARLFIMVSNYTKDIDPDSKYVSYLKYLYHIANMKVTSTILKYQRVK